MLKNYIKTAWRNLWKGRVFNAMNIIGLSVAIASSTLLLLTVFFEFSYDSFHQNKNDLYEAYFTVNRTGKPEKSATMPEPLTPALKSEYPEVKYITRYTGGPPAVVKFGEKEITQSITFVDADFFNMFTFPVVKGNSKPLTGLDDIALTETSAKEIFNNTNPIGKSILLKYNDTPKSFIVSSVIADPPRNSSIQAGMIVRFENNSQYKDLMKAWDSRNHIVFLQLQKNANAAHFETTLNPFIRNHFKQGLDDLKRDGAKILPNGERESLNLIPFLATHFDAEINGAGGSISKTYVMALLVIAIFILVIACINFINLSVARSFTRAREVGVRKTLGAGKWQLLSQFWTETLMICLIAFIAGIALAAIILPGFNAAFRSHISLAMLVQPIQLLGIVTLFLFTTVIAGFYPAMLMMSYKTTQVLKGSVNTSKPGQVRNVLLVVQFSLATILTICTLITWQQISYLQNKPLGYNKTEVLSIPIGSSVNGGQALQLFRNQFAGRPGVIAITGAFTNLGRGQDGSNSSSIIGFNYKGHEVRSTLQRVDFDYIKTLDIKLQAGRDFSHEFKSDSNNVLVNEKMAAQLNAGKSVVGTFLPMHDNKPPMQIVGVFKDYNFQSLHDEIQPLSLIMEKQYPINYIFVRLRSNNLHADLDEVKKLWHQTFPNIEFTGSWLNENTEKQYNAEKRLSTIFISAAIIAIIISCIGLLAISIMVIVQRTKEIGIRKVLGASISGIVLLISREFVKLVLLASIIAFPIAWFVMHKWLESFAYRVTIQWWIFASAAIIALLIALATISYQAIRAAVANPVKSLKSE